MPPLSPIELFLPNGYAEGSIVLGDRCPPSLVPDRPEDPDASSAVDLVILAPSEQQQRDRSWITRSAALTASRLSPRGIAYLVPSTANRLRRALASAGLDETAALLHVPNVREGRYIAAVGTKAERYALTGPFVTNKLKRLAAIGLGARGRTRFGPVGIVYRRARDASLGNWVFELGGTAQTPGSILVSAGVSGRAVLYRFVDDEPTPGAIAKVTPRAAAETTALRTLAPIAASAGARVPSILHEGEHAMMPLLLESVVNGRNAAILVAQRDVPRRELQQRLADWLQRWALASLRPRALTHADLERHVLSAAADLLPAADRYLRHLRALCSRAEGSTCPFVAAHGDLTAANVLLDESSVPGIVDWEEATAESLPLMDFFYAMADVDAARGRYADRVAAVVDCFGHEGRAAPFVASLRQSLANALAVDETVQEVAFHACWLHHAANEAARSAGVEGPFGSIVRMLAANPERFTALPRE